MGVLLRSKTTGFEENNHNLMSSGYRLVWSEGFQVFRLAEHLETLFL